MMMSYIGLHKLVAIVLLLHCLIRPPLLNQYPLAFSREELVHVGTPVLVQQLGSGVCGSPSPLLLLQETVVH